MRNQNRVLAVGALAAALMAVSASAGAAVVVAPGAFANALGNGQGMHPLRTYGTGGHRYQQVYTSALFGDFTASESITSIAFRAKQKPLGTFIGNSVSVTNIIIRLSTTAKSDVGGLDARFANNVGGDATIVYSGPLTLTTAAGGTTAIDYVINFQNGFTYNKGAGNLLLDFTIPDNAAVSGNGSIGFAQFDTVTDAFPSADGISSAFGATGSGTIGANSTTGLVTRFTSTAVPTPGALGLAAGSLVLGLRRKR